MWEMWETPRFPTSSIFLKGDKMFLFTPNIRELFFTVFCYFIKNFLMILPYGRYRST